MKVWITKYALTAGIEEMEAEACGEHMIVEKVANWARYFHREGRDWHRTRESALARCEVMRKAKLVALEKQRKKIEALRFDLM